MTITYQPLQPHPPQQQRKALTLALMIMMVAFATLLTIIRLTITPGMSGQTFAPPSMIEAISTGGRDTVEKRPALNTKIAQDNIVNEQVKTTLLKKIITIQNKIQPEMIKTVPVKQVQHNITATKSIETQSGESPSHYTLLDSHTSQTKTSDDPALTSKTANSASLASTAITGLMADQRFEKEYRDDPVTDSTEMHILAKIPRKPKLVFDKSDLDETKIMRIDKKEGCGEADGGYADLLVIVNSAAYNFEARAAIRDTWGKFAIERGAYFYFLIGSTDEKHIQAKIEAEDAKYEDLLQGSFFDSYHNLTLKTITMMRWVAERCSKIRYVLKVDDDMMLNMQHITDFAEINPNFHKVIIGKLAKKWKPHRDTKNKWYVPMEAFNGTYFPNFVTGPAYFITGDAAKPLYETAIHDRAPLYLEDVYMTGIVAEKAGIKRFNHALMRNTHLKVDQCTYPKIMTSHKHKPNEIRELWNLVYTKKCIPAKQTPVVAPTGQVVTDKTKNNVVQAAAVVAASVAKSPVPNKN